MVSRKFSHTIYLSNCSVKPPLSSGGYKLQFDKEEEKNLKVDLVIKNISEVTLRMEQVADIEIRKFENDIYIVINCSSLEEVKKKAKKEYGKDKEKQEFFESIWESREVYKKTLS